MKPIRHAGSNVLYKGPTPEIDDLWCERVEPGEIHTVWELADEERAAIAAGGRVVLMILSEPIPPVALGVLAPGSCTPDDLPDVLPEWMS
jgi:hypothetical protein